MQVPVSALTASITVGCRARSPRKLGDARSAAAMPAALRIRKGAASAGEGGLSPLASDRLIVQAGGSTARCRAGSKEGATLAKFGRRAFNGMIIASIGIAPPRD